MTEKHKVVDKTKQEAKEEATRIAIVYRNAALFRRGAEIHAMDVSGNTRLICSVEESAVEYIWHEAFLVLALDHNA